MLLRCSNFAETAAAGGEAVLAVRTREAKVTANADGSNGGVQHRAHAQRAMKPVKLNEKQRHDCSRHCPQHIC